MQEKKQLQPYRLKATRSRSINLDGVLGQYYGPSHPTRVGMVVADREPLALVAPSL